MTAEPTPQVRAAAPDDRDAVAELRWRWSVEENRATPRMSHDEYLAGAAAWFAAHEATHRGFVADLEGRIIGMAWLAVTPRFPTPQSTARITADLQSVYVDPGHRGRGIGAGLVRAALEQATRDGAERMVVHSSEGAVRLYERAGFAAGPRLLDIDLR